MVLVLHEVKNIGVVQVISQSNFSEHSSLWYTEQLEHSRPQGDKLAKEELCKNPDLFEQGIAYRVKAQAGKVQLMTCNQK